MSERKSGQGTVVIRKSTLTDDVFTLLKKRILEGEYQAGDRLKQDHLCRELGVSSSPVREALNKLENDGWLTNEPHCGRVVRAPDPKEITETYQIRTMLECFSVEEAMKNTDSISLEPLKEIVDRMRNAAERRDHRQLLVDESHFHQEIVLLSGNRVLFDLYQRLLERGRAFLVRKQNVKSARDEIEKTFPEHEAIFEALLNHDGETAKARLRSHILGGRKRLDY